MTSNRIKQKTTSTNVKAIVHHIIIFEFECIIGTREESNSV